ncbi:hypothetical protein ANN_00155 [Periplaneta americana]|uniref:Mos1 transposase HTH domain-containing protein n=1 Tax=Periplaneta americana TaxID=6978 RepID=A0ABQ8TQ25_PERAM|nr:hypothetical protein ANN_00155 [Periplaneta americana]
MARGHSAQECFQELREACGDAALPYLTVARWAKAFREGLVAPVPKGRFTPSWCLCILGHVLGSCPRGELLINARYHKVRTALASTIKCLEWQVHEEIHCLSTDGSHRRADIIKINRCTQKAIIIDPTIRCDRDLQQTDEVDKEKKSIYDDEDSPCDYLTFALQLGTISRKTQSGNQPKRISNSPPDRQANALKPELRRWALFVNYGIFMNT